MLKSNHHEQVQLLETKYNGEINILKTKFKVDENTLRVELEQDIENHVATIKQLKLNIDTLKKNHLVETKEMEEKHKVDIEIANKQCKEQIEVSNEISSYPNPTDGLVVVGVGGKDQGITISVFNIRGKRMLIQYHILGSSRQTELDLSNLSRGVYFVQIDGETTHKKLKIIKL